METPSSPRAGRLLLHYKIVRPIGSGGMGEVYEAEDTKLGRRVALKFLPATVAHGGPMLERFRREARAASALNHPNICTIYAIEDPPSTGAGETAPFIAMELLEGESLDRRLAARPLAWDALVETAIQIADALDAAHQRGIVHRDIKPGNIFLTTGGRAKVLDFGVAKIDSRVDETLGATAAGRALTDAGSAVGTIAYMSPEQARGDELDARSDIFSLAAVLYEMATGRRAFDGKTTAVIFQKILDGTPAPPREINPTLPPKLEDVILRGLEKDRELRYQTAGDLRADLKRLKRDTTSGTLAFVPPAGAASASAPLSSDAILVMQARRHKALTGSLAALGLVLLAAAGYGVYALMRGASVAPPEATYRGVPVRLTTSGDVRGCGAISPDGKYVVYCTIAGELNVRQVATGSTVTIGKEVGTTTFSPDGDYVYLSRRTDEHPTGVVWAIPTLGGEKRRVVSNAAGGVGISPDGRQVAFLRANPETAEIALMIADAFGGNERRLASGSLKSAWFDELGVSWSSDGRFISAAQASIAGGYRVRPVVINVDTGKIEPLGTTTWSELGRTVWLPGNAGVLFTARERFPGPFQFWIARYPEGTVRRVTNDARGFGNASVSVTADGSTIATVPWDVVSNLWVTSADASAPLEQWTSGVRSDGNSGIAPQNDGRIFYASADGSDVGIWSIDAPSGQPRKLTREYAEVPSTPDDGRFVVYQAIHENRYRIWRMQPDGTDARVLSRGEDDIGPFVSPDGRWIYYSAAGEQGRIMRMSPDGGNSSKVTAFPVMPMDLSADGRSLLVRETLSAERPYSILDAETGAVTARLSLTREAHPAFGRRPDLVAYILDQNGVGNLWEQPIAGGPPRRLTNFTSGRLFHFAYSPDGKRLVLARGTRTGDVVLIRDFQ